ncbi:MAG: hypothetical protein HFF00_08085 [Ruminiclostridium sp.]|jgi:hypothetical protein|nr:hypothetical protein [Ruminiclostridium sp.]
MYKRRNLKKRFIRKINLMPMPEPGDPFHQELLQAMLTEYSSLREEAQHDDTHQIQLVTISFSTLVALVSAAAVFGKRLSVDMGFFLLVIILPCLVMFMGLLWIDLIYRRTRFGCYTKIMENKLNSLLLCEKQFLEWKRWIEWEHWIEELEDGTGFLNVTRFFRGYIVSGSWLAAPLLVTGSYLVLGKKSPIENFHDIVSMCCSYWPVALFVIIIYIIYYGFFAIYLKKITQFPHKIQ